MTIVIWIITQPCGDDEVDEDHEELDDKFWYDNLFKPSVAFVISMMKKVLWDDHPDDAKETEIMMT